MRCTYVACTKIYIANTESPTLVGSQCMRCTYIACMKIHDMKTESSTLVGTVDLNIRRVRRMFYDIQISLKLHKPFTPDLYRAKGECKWFACSLINATKHFVYSTDVQMQPQSTVVNACVYVHRIHEDPQCKSGKPHWVCRLYRCHMEERIY